MYPSNKNLILSWQGMPEIAPQWSLVGQDLPYRDDIYNSARVRFFDAAPSQMRLRPDMELWDRQLRMIYLNSAWYSGAQFAHIERTLEQHLAALESALLQHEDEAVRKMAVYKIAGIVHGTVEDFTQIYRDEENSLSILPDGYAVGMEWVSSIADAKGQIAVNDVARVNIKVLGEMKNAVTQRRLRDDFSLVVQQYDAPSSSFGAVEVWSMPE